jgi:hypothetical protein
MFFRPLRNFHRAQVMSGSLPAIVRDHRDFDDFGARLTLCMGRWYEAAQIRDGLPSSDSCNSYLVAGSSTIRNLLSKNGDFRLSHENGFSFPFAGLITAVNNH